MNSRKTYRIIFKLLILIGAGFVAIPFIASLSTNNQVESDAWSNCYVGDMQPGELKKFSTAWIYKRTSEDKNSINRFIHLLQDPYSRIERQPEASRNVWRSVNEDYFIFLPGAARAIVKFSKAERLPVTDHINAEMLDSVPYYWEPLNHRIWDMSGRVVKHDGHPVEQNLFVPIVQWKNKNQVMVYTRHR